MLRLLENMTEELLDIHKAEISRLKNSYQQYRDMYEKLAERQKLWDDYLDLEVTLCQNIFLRFWDTL